MKILVGIKRVIDFAIKTRVRQDGKWMETEGIKHSINPFDEIALEEAIRIKERIPSTTTTSITVISCGGKKAIETIRSALAMGADNGILVDSETEIAISPSDGTLQPLTVAKVLAAIVKKENPDIVLLGKQAIDDDCNQTGQILAGILKLPQAIFASKIEIIESGEALVQTEIDGGLQEIRLKLPAIITVDLRLNEPRLTSLQNIMKAKKKPIETISIQTLLQESSDIKPRLEILNVTDPPPRAAGYKVETVHQLVELLQKEAKVLD